MRFLISLAICIQIVGYAASGAVVVDSVRKSNLSKQNVAVESNVDPFPGDGTSLEIDLRSRKSGRSTGLQELGDSEGPAVSPKRSRRSLIVPGTNWCGVGNNSRDNDDAGIATNGVSDQCCRDHDHCPHTIAGFTRKYNMYNYRFYTLSHCECDDM